VRHRSDGWPKPAIFLPQYQGKKDCKKAVFTREINKYNTYFVVSSMIVCNRCVFRTGCESTIYIRAFVCFFFFVMVGINFEEPKP
jgi:hypothetical protein